MILYLVHCDGCGAFIASSEPSARAARADASMKHGANHGPDGDHCFTCRKARTKRTVEDYARAAGAAHGVGAAGQQSLKS